MLQKNDRILRVNFNSALSISFSVNHHSPVLNSCYFTHIHFPPAPAHTFTHIVVTNPFHSVYFTSYCTSWFISLEYIDISTLNPVSIACRSQVLRIPLSNIQFVEDSVQVSVNPKDFNDLCESLWNVTFYTKKSMVVLSNFSYSCSYYFYLTIHYISHFTCVFFSLM